MLGESNLYDMHTHIIPAVDDGAGDSAVAREMLRRSFEQGVRHIILTSHYSERYGMTADVGAGFAEAKALAAEISPELKLYLGNELYFSSSIVEKLQNHELYTLAGSRYVLVEFSSSVEISLLRGSVNELMLHGYRPIIAHVERYSCLYGGLAYELAEMGALFQINAGSVLQGSFRVRRFCRQLLADGLLSFIASDCHNLADRPPNLAACAQFVHKKFGESCCKKLFCENPRQIVLDKDLE